MSFDSRRDHPQKPPPNPSNAHSPTEVVVERYDEPNKNKRKKILKLFPSPPPSKEIVDNKRVLFVWSDIKNEGKVFRKHCIQSGVRVI